MIKKTKIVILSHQGLGDSLMMVPLIRNCREILKENEQMVVMMKSNIEISILNYESFNGKIIFMKAERDKKIFKYFTKFFFMALRLRLMKPDILIAPLLVDRLSNALWIMLIGAEISVGPPGKWLKWAFTACVEWNKDFYEHEVEYFNKCGTVAGLPLIQNPDVTLPITKEYKEKASLILKQENKTWIALGPGSGAAEAHKRWPKEHYRSLVQLLVTFSSNINIALFGSSHEKELIDYIIKDIQYDHSRFKVFIDGDLKLVLALVAQCRCMVASTVGLGHLAAAAATPIVVPCEPTNPCESGPYSKHAWIVRAGFKCAPCYRQELRFGCGKMDCMSFITPQQVFEAVCETIAGVMPPPVPSLKTTNAFGPSI